MKTKILLFTSLFMFLLSSCDDLRDDVLDRQQLTSYDDVNYWTSEGKLRLYVNEFYPRHFVGYNTGYRTEYTAYLGYQFSDDILYSGTQTQFELSVPNSRGETPKADAEAATNIPWIEKYSGPTWNFSWIRKANILMDRIETRMGGILSEEEKNHWLGIGRFFRAMEYAGLVTVFGDVPYYDREIGDKEFDEIYKQRTPRNEVMDAVYDDLVFAMNNVRLSDGAQYVNRDVVAGYVSRLALFEGTWQKYHKNNTERAKKFLSLAVQAAEIIRSTGKYDIVTDFRSLFGSEDLSGNKDCIFYRAYNLGQGVSHSVATSNNLVDGRYYSPTLALMKSFICSDGSDWQTSADANNRDFSMANLIKTRDSRFEATFYNKVTLKGRGSYLYVCKFINRDGLKYLDAGASAPEVQYTSILNENDYPVMRYAEVLLNLIEAKAELATMGGDVVTQADINATINKIRNRPVAAAAAALGVVKTTAMDLSQLPSSPNRGDVSQLIWEIRRERRMELAFEHSRILDLRRWKKLDYMDDTQNADILRGTWLNIPVDAPELITAANVGVVAVTDLNGNVTVYNGSNATQMVGFYSPTNIQGRLPFLNVSGVNPYLAPVGKAQRISYMDKGYDLAQTEGWPSDL